MKQVADSSQSPPSPELKGQYIYDRLALSARLLALSASLAVFRIVLQLSVHPDGLHWTMSLLSRLARTAGNIGELLDRFQKYVIGESHLDTSC